MKKYIPIILSGVAAITLSGCAEMNSIHRLRGVNPLGQTQLIDAKQRAIVMVPNVLTQANNENRDTANYLPQYRMCAEPSPDVFSIMAMAATARGNLNTVPGAGGQTTANGDFAIGSSENASTIERTQTINLMRESMYRTCERYLSGAIDEDTMQIQAARDQRSMVAVLAIEQLTGVVKRQPTILTTQTQATLVTANEKLVQQQIKESEDLARKKTAFDEAQEKLNKANADYTALNDGKCETILTTPAPDPATQAQAKTQVTETTKSPDGTEKKVENTEIVDTAPSEEAVAAADLLASQSQCRASKNAVSAAEATLAAKKDTQEKAQDALDATRALLEKMAATMHTVTSGGEGTGDGGSNPYSKDQIEIVAKTVGEIAEAAFDPYTEMVYVCTNVVTKFGNYREPEPEQVEIINKCMQILESKSTQKQIELLNKAEAAKQELDFKRSMQHPVAFNKSSFEIFWDKVRQYGSLVLVDPQELQGEIVRVNKATPEDFTKFFKGLDTAKTKDELRRIFNSLDNKYKTLLAAQ